MEASNCKLPVYRDSWLCCKVHPPNKGCVICNKTMRLTDEYVLNSEVRLTSGLYGIQSQYENNGPHSLHAANNQYHDKWNLLFESYCLTVHWAFCKEFNI